MQKPDSIAPPQKPIQELKLLVDSADVAVWERLLPYGLFSGVTTNPKLLHQANQPCTLSGLRRLAQTAFGLGAQEIHLQVWGLETDAMLAIGKELAAIDARVCVKVPGTSDGLRCARSLIAEGARVTLTALHAAPQALVAAALGADYAVPYLGRMNAAGLDGLAETIAMQEILERFPGNPDRPTRVLVASIRELGDVAALARRGVGVFALLAPLATALLDHPLSIQAAEDFEAHARATQPG